MAGLVQACPGHPRLGCGTKDVDARVPQTSLRSLRKLDCVPAHDGETSAAVCTRNVSCPREREQFWDV